MSKMLKEINKTINEYKNDINNIIFIFQNGNIYHKIILIIFIILYILLL